MLVLSRQVDEVLMTGTDIQVTIVAIRGDKVRLGITAPKAIAVHRKEVFDAIRREQLSTSQAIQETKRVADPGKRPGGVKGPTLATPRRGNGRRAVRGDGSQGDQHDDG
jgi:carbon storage regulator